MASSRKQATRLMLSQRTMQGSVCDNGKHIGYVLVSRQRLVFMSPRTFIPVARTVLWSYFRILPFMLFIRQTVSVRRHFCECWDSSCWAFAFRKKSCSLLQPYRARTRTRLPRCIKCRSGSTGSIGIAMDLCQSIFL
jgi:hypothetical protein